MPAYPSTPPAHRLADLGFDPGWAAAAETARAGLPAGADHHPHPGHTDPGHFELGRAVRADRGHLLVQTATDLVHVRCTLDAVTGDWLLTGPDLVAAVLPRRTAVVRGAGRRDARAQVLAANVDVVLVVVALASAPNLSRLDRLLTVAWDSGAQPVIVLTKADLCRTAESEAAEVAEHAPGVPVHVVSAVDGRGLEALAAAELAPGRTVALLGVSGAGKSSLVNALAGADLAQVREVRDDGKGRHTTTSRELIVLPGFGVLLDTPGMRGVQLWDAEEGLAQTFADIAELARHCRFADCAHETEPGCAVQEAVAAGRLSARRLASMRKLEREVTWLQSRYDARLRAERKREWQQFSKQLRERNRWHPHR